MRREGYQVRLVNVEANEEMAYQYRIRYVPTFIYVKDGREVRRKSGYMSEASLKRLMRDSWF